jgi:hypothetical protein
MVLFPLRVYVPLPSALMNSIVFASIVSLARFTLLPVCTELIVNFFVFILLVPPMVLVSIGIPSAFIVPSILCVLI